MSRRLKIPTYRLHKQSGQAVVTLRDPSGNRRDVLLGRFDTPDSRQEYARVIAEWEARGRCLTSAATQPDGRPSVNELLLAYFTHVQNYYRHPDGRPTSEVDNIRLALRWPKRLYGHTPAADFDSLALEALRGEMIQADLCRNRINKDVARIKRMFRWGASRKMVPPSVCELLRTVEGLHEGRSGAVETEPVKPVAWDVVRATLPHVSPQVAAMLELQYHTGARPGEIIILRTIDLDVSGPVWVYRPATHKNRYRGQGRAILIGPKGQAVLRPWLRLNVEEYLFQPKEARALWDAKRKQGRKTPMTPSQAKRRPKARPKKILGVCYTPSSYANAVAKGVEKANTARACKPCKKLKPEDCCQACKAAALPHFHPHQLRHAKATEIRRECGLDAARAVLGHRSPKITETYAEIDMNKAAEIMGRLG